MGTVTDSHPVLPFRWDNKPLIYLPTHADNSTVVLTKLIGVVKCNTRAILLT